MEDIGRYDTTLVLPAAHDQIREFELILPGPVGQPPLRLQFIRKRADYRVDVPIQ